MAHFILIENPFDQKTHKHFLHQKARTPLEWVKNKFKGFKEFTHPTVCFVNDEPMFREEWGTKELKDSDVVTFTTVVGELTSILIGVLVSVVLSVAITLLIPPPKQPGQQNEPDDVYKLAGQYNQFKLGEPIEVVYGQVRRWPTYAAASYNQYIDQKQFLYASLCVGQGEFELQKVQIEDTNITSFDNSNFDFIEPGQNPAGLFENNVITSTEVSNVEILGSNEEQYSDEDDGWFGPIVLNTAGTLCNKIQLDITFPQGLYRSRTSGKLGHATVEYELEFQAVDSNELPISEWANPDTFMKVERYMRDIRVDKYDDVTVGAWVPYSSFEKVVPKEESYSYGRGRRWSGDDTETVRPPWENLTYEFPEYGEFSGGIFGILLNAQYGINDSVWVGTDGLGEQGQTINTYGGEVIEGYDTQKEVKIYGAGFTTVTRTSNTPLRYTRTEIMPYEGRWQFRIRRHNLASLDHKIQDSMFLESARAFLPSNANFGDVTLLAVAAQASHNLNDSSQQRINVWVTRKLPTWDVDTGWSEPVETRSIVWAFCDIFRSQYGGKFGDEYLDLESLKELDDFYTSRGDFFDYIFDSKTTVLDAAKTVARAGRGVPMINGSKITIVRDSPSTLPTAMFGAHNIIKGSFKWEMSFLADADNDAVEAVYIDGDTFKEETVMCGLSDDPEEPTNPKQIKMHGISNRDKAYQEGLYIRANERHTREKVTFRTGLEGRVPEFGDFIGVSHDAPQWGMSGHVRSINGTVVELKDKVEFIEGETHQLGLRDRYGALQGPYTVTAGAHDKQVVLPNEVDTSNLILDNSATPSMFLFGVTNEFYHQMKVTKLANGNNNTVTVTCVNYSPIPHSFDGVIAPALDVLSPTVDVPDVPTMSTVVVEALPNTLQQVIIKWQPVLGAFKYAIEFSDNGEDWVPLTETVINFYTAQVTAGMVWIRVAAVGQGQSPWEVWQGVVGEFPEGVTFDPPEGGNIGPFPIDVTLSTETLGAVVRWSTTAVPENDADGEDYTGPVQVEAGQTIYARAFVGTILASDGSEATYIQVPSMDFSQGENSQYTPLI